jgi:EmrB/QacA subfamily drug resistance transporter
MSACVIMAVALVAAINLAIPKLAVSALRPSDTGVLWIVDSYVIVFACLLIPAGAIGDRYGRKGALLGGLALFGAGAAACALAPSVAVLVAGRVLGGAGAALVMPATLSLALQAYPAARRAHVIAVWTAATGAAGMVGNVLGGLVMRYLPWQALFWCVVPIAAALFALVAWLAPRGERHRAALDIRGTVLLVTGFVLLLFAILSGPERGWASPWVLGGFAAAAVVLAGFAWHALRTPDALIDPRIFRIPRLRAGTVGVGLTFFGLFALFLVNAQYLQYARGYSPVLTGVAIGPLALGMMAVSARAAVLTARFGVRRVTAIGLFTLAGGLGLLSLTGVHTPYAAYAAILLVVSAGMGLSMPALSGAIITSLPPGREGLGSGLNSAAREIGSALGIAIMGTILAGRFGAALPSGVSAHSVGQALAIAHGIGPEAARHVVTAFVDGVALGYRVVAVIVLAATVPVLLWLRESTR